MAERRESTRRAAVWDWLREPVMFTAIGAVLAATSDGRAYLDVWVFALAFGLAGGLLCGWERRRKIWAIRAMLQGRDR